MNILFTGGRAPATLELARAFHRAGHVIFMAESLCGHLSQPSKVIAKNFIVPPPRQKTAEFINALKTIILENKIDLLIPTCEEIFYVSMGKDQLPCTVFAEPIKKLSVLHDKWAFTLNAFECNLPVPETILIVTIGDMFQAYSQWRELVIKPVYSRFAARAMILPKLNQALATVKRESPWVAQDYIEGMQICTYSVCHNGRIAAHTAYPSIFTAGQGATIVFKPIHHPAIFEWVKTFVEKNQFTGQIAFDFIQSPDGKIFALECNPRATSGAHLFASHPKFAEAFLNPQMECIMPLDDHSYMLTNAMLVYGLPASIKKKNFTQWLNAFLTSSDVILDFKDPLPFLLQVRSIFSYLKIAREHKISALEASTYDIEWNGEG
jgi:predicted ATP-grasp superfamily ATP-dependent carboligase